MQLSHIRPVALAKLHDPNLVSTAGLVPIVALAEDGGVRALADYHLTVPTDKGANAGRKVTSLVAGMMAGADSIDDMALLRHGAMGTVGQLRPGPSSLEPLRGERRLAGVCGDGVQPESRRRQPHRRPAVGESHHRHHLAHPGLGTGPYRILGATTQLAPTAGLAIGNRVEHAVRQHVPPQLLDHRLTSVPPSTHDAKDPVEQPDTEIGCSTTPPPLPMPHNETRNPDHSRSVDSG